MDPESSFMSNFTSGSQADHSEPFAQKMQRLTATLLGQQAEAARLDAEIAANLRALGFGE
jgi:type I restriction enzyme M protein